MEWSCASCRFQPAVDLRCSSVWESGSVPWKKGDRVDARYLGGQDWLPGIISSVAGKGYVSVAYDSGKREARVPLRFLRRQERQPNSVEDSEVDRAELCKDKGNSRFKSGQYEAAIESYSEGIRRLHGTWSDLACKLHNNRAQCQMQLRNYDSVIADVSSVLENETADTMSSPNPNARKARLRRGKSGTQCNTLLLHR